jgi:hypothetical protein
MRALLSVISSSETAVPVGARGGLVSRPLAHLWTPFVALKARPALVRDKVGLEDSSRHASGRRALSLSARRNRKGEAEEEGTSGNLADVRHGLGADGSDVASRLDSEHEPARVGCEEANSGASEDALDSRGAYDGDRGEGDFGESGKLEAADGAGEVEAADVHPLNVFWEECMKAVDRPSATKMRYLLQPQHVLGIDPSAKGVSSAKDGLYSFFKDVRRKHPTKVLLVRVGDFYEAYGYCAVILVQYAGLNPVRSLALAKRVCWELSKRLVSRARRCEVPCAKALRGRRSMMRAPACVSADGDEAAARGLSRGQSSSHPPRPHARWLLGG